MPRRLVLLFGLIVIAVAGCGGVSSVKEQDIEVKVSNDPLHEPRMILKQYAEGQPMGSEASNFPALIESVRKTDADRADVLEKGLQEIKDAPPEARPNKAKELLTKLQPSMT